MAKRDERGEGPLVERIIEALEPTNDEDLRTNHKTNLKQTRLLARLIDLLVQEGHVEEEDINIIVADVRRITQ
jgi:hypothetical protein